MLLGRVKTKSFGKQIFKIYKGGFILLVFGMIGIPGPCKVVRGDILLLGYYIPQLPVHITNTIYCDGLMCKWRQERKIYVGNKKTKKKTN